jgi:ribosomal protein S18 acetylase RimI-like enzyme
MAAPIVVMDPVTIRRATAADLPHIGRLGALMVDVHHRFDPARFLPSGEGTAAAYGAFLGRQLEAPDGTILVAEVAGDVIGYAYAALEGFDYMALRGPAGVLHDVIVDPEHRQHGAGRLLVEAALRWMESRGASQVVLATATGNEAARRLFHRLGFRPTMIEMTRELG